MQTKTLSLTRILLLCGAIAGPLFILTVLIQDYTRPAFDPRLEPLSHAGRRVLGVDGVNCRQRRGRECQSAEVAGDLSLVLCVELDPSLIAI